MIGNSSPHKVVYHICMYCKLRRKDCASPPVPQLQPRNQFAFPPLSLMSHIFRLPSKLSPTASIILFFSTRHKSEPIDNLTMANIFFATSPLVRAHCLPTMSDTHRSTVRPAPFSGRAPPLYAAIRCIGS
jgi:hypothetical protein